MMGASRRGEPDAHTRGRPHQPHRPVPCGGGGPMAVPRAHRRPRHRRGHPGGARALAAARRSGPSPTSWSSAPTGTGCCSPPPPRWPSSSRRPTASTRCALVPVRVKTAGPRWRVTAGPLELRPRRRPAHAAGPPAPPRARPARHQPGVGARHRTGRPAPAARGAHDRLRGRWPAGVVRRPRRPAGRPPPGCAGTASTSARCGRCTRPPASGSAPPPPGRASSPS